MNQLVIMNNQQAVTTSLSVAENFNKRHDHVLRDIDEIKGVTQNWGDLFQEATYIHPQNKQSYRMYYMNRDGFTVLAMGFTGKEALQFKLKYIEAFNAMEAELTKPKSQAELIAMMAQVNVEQERRINEAEKRVGLIEAKQDNITQILSLNPVQWRSKVTTILNRIGQARGGFNEFRNVRNESYEVLEQRAHCKLGIRLENRRKNLLMNGVSNSKACKITKLDVIADDTRLTEIYLAIIKEMAIKYQVNAEGLGA